MGAWNEPFVVVDVSDGDFGFFFFFVFFVVFHFLILVQGFSWKVHLAGLQIVDFWGLLFWFSRKDSQ